MTRYLVFKTVQSCPSKMGSRCELDMENIITASMEDLSLEEQQKFQALQEYMKVQFLAGVKKDRHGKVARLKEFEPRMSQLLPDLSGSFANWR